jgi:hypothetical protein
MELVILDKEYRQIAIEDTFESLIWTDRYYEPGDFEIYISAEAVNAMVIEEDFYVFLRDSEHVMIVEAKEIESDAENGNHMIITGRSLESILDRRIVWKQTTISGKLQDGIEQLLNENAIKPTNVNRKIANLIFEPSTDERITGLTVEAQYTGDNLLTVIENLCKTNNLGFKITLNDNNQFVFSLYIGEDRSYDQLKNPYVIFSPKYENIVNSNYLESKKTLKTITLVAGEGEGAARRTLEVECSDGEGFGLDRREMFTDARDISSTIDGGTLSVSAYNAQLKQRGTEDLAENTLVKTFEGQVEASQMFVYGQDFYMGDIVQTANEYGIEGKTRVTEFIRSQSTSGYDEYPTFTTVE